MNVIIPPMKRVPPGATMDKRRAMYADYMRELADANPRFAGEIAREAIRALEGRPRRARRWWHIWRAA